METVAHDYSSKGVQFYYVYKALAHPEWNGYITPFTLKERLMQIQEAKRTLGARIPWLCDKMDNSFKHAMGNAPNSEFLIGPDGVIVGKRIWSKPDKLREDLEDLLGSVEHVTTVAELGLKTAPPPKPAPSGIVDPIERPEDMRPMHVKPVSSEGQEPYYAKLRVEADEALIENGSGKLYLGFILDPLYNVHWNNLTSSAIQVVVKAPDGVTITPTVLKGPKVDAETDVDPREFLLDVKGASETTTFTVKTFYYACNDDEGWCKPLTQEYAVNLSRDRDGGSVIPASMSRRMSGMMKGDKKANRRLREAARGKQGDLSTVVGSWSMTMSFQGQEMEAKLTLAVENGKLVGMWSSENGESKLSDVSFVQKTLRFARSMGPMDLTFEGAVKGDAVTGAYKTPMGDIKTTGKRLSK